MPRVLDYIRRFDLPVISLNDGLPRYLIDGKTAEAADLADWPWALTDQERNVTVSSNLNRYLFLHGIDTNTVLQPGWPDADTIRHLNGVTLGELISRAGASPAFLELLDAHGGLFTSQSSALGSMPDLAYHFGDQNLFRILGGNDRLPAAMAEAIGDRIVLATPVTAIDQTGSRVKVAMQRGRELTADAVISTIPFRVLQEIDVRPVWSAGKRRMLAEMGWGNTVKVVAQTRTPSWLDKGVHGWPMAGGDRKWERVIDITGDEPGGHGNTFFYLNGRNADAVLARPAETRAREIVDLFRADMPDLFDEVIAIEDFAWSEQPWVRGSFGDLPVEWRLEDCRVDETRGSYPLRGRFHHAQERMGRRRDRIRAARGPPDRPRGAGRTRSHRYPSQYPSGCRAQQPVWTPGSRVGAGRWNSTTSEETARNSLCQFWNDWNQNSLVRRNSTVETA